MFDLSLAKLGVIGIVALIVLGPSRFSQAARALGIGMGRAQRYLSALRSDLSGQLESDALRDIHNNMQDAAHTAKQMLHDALYPTTSPARGSHLSSEPQRSFRRAVPHITSSQRTLRVRSPIYFYHARARSFSHPMHYRRHIGSQVARVKRCKIAPNHS